jgi:hypothetical protein
MTIFFKLGALTTIVVYTLWNPALRIPASRRQAALVLHCSTVQSVVNRPALHVCLALVVPFYFEEALLGAHPYTWRRLPSVSGVLLVLLMMLFFWIGFEFFPLLVADLV